MSGLCSSEAQLQLLNMHLRRPGQALELLRWAGLGRQGRHNGALRRSPQISQGKEPVACWEEVELMRVSSSSVW